MAIRNSRELVIEASKAPVDNVYFIGPYGARVSFASQQRRALNLIWALRETGRWPTSEQPRAAVVGCGIAGLMVAAALRMQGCSVWMYESAGSVLSLQAGATHRYVHPTINFWPEQELAWTTEFPFFDWYASSCDEIIKTIERQWTANFRKKLARLETNWTFKKFKAGTGKRAGKVLMMFDKRPEQQVDLLFITTGFGPERDLGDPRYKSYWDVDRLDAMSLDAGKRYVVSGTGDGGVIDTLRLTYTGFMSSEIALRFLTAIDSKALRTIVQEVERKAEPMDPVDRAVFYHEQYTDIASNQDDGAKDLLLDLIPGKNPIELIGRGPHPYDIGAAPIHKMILALSIELGRVRYTQGSVRRERGKYWLDREGKPTEPIVADLVLARHGAKPPVEGFVTEAQREELERLQRQLGDYLDIGEYSESAYFDMPSLAAGRKRDFEGFVDSRAGLAQDFLRERFGVGVRTPVERPLQGFEMVDDRSDAETSNGGFGPVPDTVFGIPLRKPSARAAPIDDLVGRL